MAWGIQPPRGQIYTSSNSGTNWSPHASSQYWSCVAMSSDGTKVVAAVNASGVNPGQIYVSGDSGVTWVVAAPLTQPWTAIASSSDGVKLAATVSGGSVYTSDDAGATWTARASSQGWSGVAMSGDGTKLAATVNGGQIYTSTSFTTLGAAGYLTGSPASAIELQHIGNGQFLPLNHEGAVSAH